MKSLIDRAHELQAEGIFLGGPIELFETAGRKLLMTLLSEGIYPGSKVLDVGCGCLRGGYWLIHFLDKGCYFGIEPNRTMLEAGMRILLEPGITELKRPRLDHNSNFDFTVFNEKFDFVVGRSIWTHASKPQIQTMLDSFVQTVNDRGMFLTSYIPPASPGSDYAGEQWVGRSHESDRPGLVSHSFGWIQSECTRRGLVAEEIRTKEFNFSNQIWIRIRRKTV